jgi:hypothetical protein
MGSQGHVVCHDDGIDYNAEGNVVPIRAHQQVADMLGVGKPAVFRAEERAMRRIVEAIETLRQDPVVREMFYE